MWPTAKYCLTVWHLVSVPLCHPCYILAIFVDNCIVFYSNPNDYTENTTTILLLYTAPHSKVMRSKKVDMHIKTDCDW